MRRKGKKYIEYKKMFKFKIISIIKKTIFHTHVIGMTDNVDLSLEYENSAELPVNIYRIFNDLLTQQI
jgi:hypothetical protein